MKVIDLLNKIANGEEVPNKILYVGDYYFWNKHIKFYYTQEGISLYREMFTEGNCLNDEVKIIEDEFIDIKELYDNSTEFNFSDRQTGMTKEDRRLLDSNFKELGNKINDLIKNQKKIIDKLKGK